MNIAHTASVNYTPLLHDEMKVVMTPLFTPCDNCQAISVVRCHATDVFEPLSLSLALHFFGTAE